MARVGYDQVIGYLDGGFECWSAQNEKLDCVERITVDELLGMEISSSTIVDVRKPGEYEASHINDANLLPLDFIQENIKDYPGEPFILHCAGGYRSMIAASILKRHNMHKIKDVIGGFNAIPSNSEITSTFVCPSGN